jgi:hypothetical protein
MSIQPKNSWLYQGLALLLWLVCMEPAWPSSLSSDRPKITTYLLEVDRPAPTVHPDFDLELLKNRTRQKPKQTEQLLAQSTEQTAPEQDPPRKSRYKRSPRQVRSLSVPAIGAATLGTHSITKAFGAALHKNNWLSSLVFTMILACAMGALYSFYLQLPIRRNRSTKDTHVQRIPQAALPIPLEDSDRKPIQVNAEIYWNKQLYKGRATEIDALSMRVEMDNIIRGLKILMPVGLIIGQDAIEIPKRFLVQVVSIQPLVNGGNHRSVLELRFPKRWQQQQNQRIEALINVLH